MPRPGLRPPPHPDELWLSRPPYRMIARVVEVDPHCASVSYVLYDEEGSSLEHVARAPLDDSWWQAFQPLTRRQG